MTKFAMTAIVIALGIGAQGAVLADEGEGYGPPRTRAEVVAERDAASAAGLIAAMNGEDSGSFYLSQQRPVATLSRADVVAEMLAARRSGEMAALVGEDSGSFYLARASTRPAPLYTGPGPEEATAVRLAQAGSTR